MPYPHQFNRITFFGTLATGQEEWQTGINFGLVDGNAAPLTEEELGLIYGTFGGTIMNPVNTTDRQGAMGSSAILTGVKSNLVNPDGSMGPGVFYQPTTGTTGTGLSNQWNQISMVATLRSSKTRGPASRGRMYIPNVGGPVGTNGHVDAGTVQAFRNNVRDFINALNTQITGVFQYALLASPGGVTGAADMQRITAIQVGNVVDTQRRRRNGLTETYTSDPIT